ncbi:uncharacterized protein BCR38DRAFT_195131 [Pseudomassariella vexata]|uniref:Secreted protein n=1 Tax=Pseudomassariella vexata TaxID=1141098 RepID=A0A1Y2E369_9PEZI|nr:uncharacterized protein BCR38DRAFT_195131 [Pseudomassariella vexata]ORY65315.1 hypothetical protein BCR38DRAFT_195131 [Pseudomassariella vexata]
MPTTGSLRLALAVATVRCFAIYRRPPSPSRFYEVMLFTLDCEKLSAYPSTSSINNWPGEFNTSAIGDPSSTRILLAPQLNHVPLSPYDVRKWSRY